MTSAGISTAFTAEVGKYRLIARLARGGMGDVYLAVAQGPAGFHKVLVVKELRPEFAEDETYVAMFLEEARLAARLSHPNVVQTNEVGSDGGRHFMVMEYLDGRSLYRVAKQLGQKGGLPLGAHLRVIAEGLLGLHYAHELRGFDGEALGIVHRDVSPLNVFVTFDGQAKVLDFGIAKAVDSALETRAGVIKGRIAYMAPEQASGAKVDRRADVYAAGVMIWEAAAGRRLWPGMSDVEILMRTLGEGPPSLRSVNPAAPADLDSLCSRAMARSPDDRHPTASALLEDLDRHLSRRADAVSMRQLGALVSRAFEPDRQRMNALIEEALVEMRGTPRSGVMKTFPAGAVERPAYGGPGDDLVSLSALLVTPPSTRTGVAAGSPNHASAICVPRPTIPDRRERPRQSGRLIAAASVAACLTAAGLAVSLWHRGESAPQAAPALPSASVPEPVAAPAPAPAPSLVEQGDRETGKIGAPKGSRSPDLPVPPAPGAAVVQRSAPPVRWAPTSAPPAQHAPKPSAPEPTRAVTVADAPLPFGPAAGPAAATPRPEVDSAGGRAPLRPIVTSNPYGAP